MKRVALSSAPAPLSPSSPDPVPSKTRKVSLVPEVIVVDDSPMCPVTRKLSPVPEVVVVDDSPVGPEMEEGLTQEELAAIVKANFAAYKRWPTEWDEMMEMRRDDDEACTRCAQLLDILEDEIDEIEELIVKVCRDGTETRQQIDQLRAYRIRHRKQFIDICILCPHEEMETEES